MVISALEAELDEGRTWVLGDIEIEMILSETTLVNDQCLLPEDLLPALVEAEEVEITGMCALDHRRGGADHLHQRVVDVDAEGAEVNEAAAMLIVLCLVPRRRIGTDIGFDLGLLHCHILLYTRRIWQRNLRAYDDFAVYLRYR